MAAIAAAAIGFAAAGGEIESPAAGGSFPSRTAPTLRGYGTWTFQRLGYGNNTFTFPHGFARPRVFFRLPIGARAGNGSWYTITLHLRIDLRSPRRGDEVTVGASVNQIGAALIQLRTLTPYQRHTRVAVVTVGIVSGTTRSIYLSRRFTLRFANYIAVSAIHSGLNTLQFLVNQPGHHIVRALTILSDSSLAHTRRAPGSVELTAIGPRTHVRVGDAFAVHLGVANVGGSTVHDVHARLAWPRNLVRRLTSTSFSIRSLAPRQRKVFTARFKATHRGALVMPATMSSSTNTAVALVRLSVARS
jgi:hypothetical protein